MNHVCPVRYFSNLFDTSLYRFKESSLHGGQNCIAGKILHVQHFHVKMHAKLQLELWCEGKTLLVFCLSTPQSQFQKQDGSVELLYWLLYSFVLLIVEGSVLMLESWIKAQCDPIVILGME